MADAVYHHEDQVVNTTIEERPAAPTPAPPKEKGPSAQLHLYPTSGGLGAGLTLIF